MKRCNGAQEETQWETYLIDLQYIIQTKKSVHTQIHTQNKVLERQGLSPAS
jgi:hypothetical protein